METSRPLILVDTDGVCADFCGGFLDAIEEETGERFGHAVITTWNITDAPFFKLLEKEHKHLRDRVWKRVNRIGWCSNLRPLPGAADAIKALREFADIEILTSPLDSSPTWQPERKEWLKRHLDVHHNDVHFTAKKHRVIGDMLIDDKVDHCLEWRRSMTHVGRALKTRIPVLFDQPYNHLESVASEQAVELVSETWRGYGWDHVLQLATKFFTGRDHAVTGELLEHYASPIF